MKLCVDCQHHIPGENTTPQLNLDRCGALTQEISLVTGKLRGQKFEYCATLRNATEEDCCGPTGRFFVSKTQGWSKTPMDGGPPDSEPKGTMG
jgi:hypothetical protein